MVEGGEVMESRYTPPEHAVKVAEEYADSRTDRRAGIEFSRDDCVTTAWSTIVHQWLAGYREAGLLPPERHEAELAFEGRPNPDAFRAGWAYRVNEEDK